MPAEKQRRYYIAPFVKGTDRQEPEELETMSAARLRELVLDYGQMLQRADEAKADLREQCVRLRAELEFVTAMLYAAGGTLPEED
jgi:hypothetical protein